MSVERKWTLSRRRLLITSALAVAAGVAAFYLVPKPLPELSRAEFLAEVRSGQVQKIEIDGDVIIATSTTRGEFRTSLKPDADELLAELRAHGVEITYSTPGLSI